MEMMMILKGLGFVALGIGAFLVMTYVVMRLWNWLVPSVFNGPRLRFVQALGLLFLTRLLVGGFGGPRGGHGYGGWGRGAFDEHRAGHHQPYHKAPERLQPAPQPQ